MKIRRWLAGGTWYYYEPLGYRGDPVWTRKALDGNWKLAKTEVYASKAFLFDLLYIAAAIGAMMLIVKFT